MSALGRLGERNQAEVRAVMAGYFHDRDAVEPVTRADLVRRINDGLVTVLDVRSEGEFALGRVPSAVNISLKDLERRLAELPTVREIVAYCRGAYCVLAFEAVALLRGSIFWLTPGIAALALFAWLLTQVDTAAAGRAAAYGGVCICASLAWLWIVEGVRPDGWDGIGAVLCLVSAAVILLNPRALTS